MKKYVLRIFETETIAVNIFEPDISYSFENVSKVIVDNLCNDDEYIVNKIIEKFGNVERSMVKLDLTNFKKELESIGLNKNSIEEFVFVNHNSKLKYCTIELTSNCNFKCKHCYIPNRDNAISFDDYKKIIDELSEMNCTEILLTGGEPFLHKNFIEMYLYAKQKGLSVGINTNLSSINNRQIEMLSQYKPRIIEITLYGYDEKSYSCFTQNDGAYSKVLNNIILLKEKDINIFSKGILCKTNKNYFLEIKELAYKLGLGFRYDYLLFPKLSEIGRNDERLEPNEIIEIVKKDKDTLLFLKDKINSDNFEFKNNNIFQCGLGESRIFIDSNLNIKPCLLVDKGIKFTNISIKNAIDDFKCLILNMKFNKNKKCLNCDRKCVCRYCPGRFYLETNDYESVPAFYCELAEKIIRMCDESDENC